MNILIVEDDKILAEMYRDGFKAKNHKVVLADSAQDALNKLDKNKVDLMVLDMLLPGRSGIEVLHELNSYMDWREIPVVLMSDVNRDKMKISDKNLAKYSVKEIIYKTKTTPLDIVSIAEKYVHETL